MPRLLVLIAVLACGYWYLTDSATPRRLSSAGFGAGPIMGGAAGQSIGGSALGLAGRISP